MRVVWQGTRELASQLAEAAEHLKRWIIWLKDNVDSWR
jgi:hypothetical protein